MTTELISFPVNNWTHLYSLEQAVLKDKQSTGKTLTVVGTIKKTDLLDKIDTLITITFSQIDDEPDIKTSDTGNIILGSIIRLKDNIECTLNISKDTFEELKKNLIEYADIDGIHIMITIGIIIEQDEWPIGEELSLTKLDYAMKGDSQ